jgi:hypothetical protein
MIWICQMSNKRRFDLDSSGCDDRRMATDSAELYQRQVVKEWDRLSKKVPLGKDA